MYHPRMTQKIAIIGSGMAGLAAAWYLGKDHEVSIYERHSRIGIGAHSIELDGHCVDVPLRVIYPGYYPELFRVLAQSGVQVEPLDASMSFSGADGETYFHYHNALLQGKSIPWMSPLVLLNPLPRQILADLGRFMLRVPSEQAAGKLRGRTLANYLQEEGYGTAFVEKFLVPCFAGINTVSNENVRNYPADTVAQYFTREFLFSQVFRAVGGATAIAQALASRITQTHLGAKIRSVRRGAEGVLIGTDLGVEAQFDAVVFATQANQVLPMLLDASPEERAVLTSFRYDSVHVLMHRDPALAPLDPRAWAPVNYLLSDTADRPMVTIWSNALLPAMDRNAPPVFQTINPHGPVDQKLVLQESHLERPIVDLQTQSWLERLQGLQAEPGRRVFFCGAYAAAGIPLLEGATVSARDVARYML
jgi:predicted NAD/FAD-binding protein